MRNKLLDFEKIRNEAKDTSIEKTKMEKVSNGIAIIGMSACFPSAGNIDEFWQNLRSGKDCIRPLPDTRKRRALEILPNAYMSQNPPVFCEAGYLDDIDKFDHEYFNISPNEAKLMDPNQRLFLETALRTFDDAGYSAKKLKGTSVGVYVGHSSDMKFEYHMYVNQADPDTYGNISLPGNVKSIIAGRISYLLDLKGPSMLIDTACSSALVCVHTASAAIKNGICDMALVGGVKINLLPIQKGLDEEIGIRSQSDRTKTFDDSSDGTGSGEGVAAVLLKDLRKAKEDGDHIYAVIKGGAVNQDGNSIGLTAPNSAAQEELIISAWKDANIDPEKISYIEVHGTATKLGDPVEIDGIERAFSRFTGRKGFCAIGSVKSNVGHLDNIAGMAGLIKVVLSMRNREIPPSLHFGRPNRKIDFISSPVFVNDVLRKWETGGTPLLAGLSSFGLAGTNCHLILEDYMDNSVPSESADHELFTVSAKTKDAVRELAKEYVRKLEMDTNLVLRDVCYTANSGRTHHNHRFAVIVGTIDELKDMLIKIYSGNADIWEKHYREVRYPEVKTVRVSISGIADEKTVSGKNAKGFHSCDFLFSLADSYLSGENIDWESVYAEVKKKKVSLPAYPFRRNSHWIDVKNAGTFTGNIPAGEDVFPLLGGNPVESPGQEIYEKTFDVVRDWVVGEHKIAGQYVMPGAAYIEMIREIHAVRFSGMGILISDILFVSPFVIGDDGLKKLHVSVKEREGLFEFTAASRSQNSDEWEIHAEAAFASFDGNGRKSDVEKLLFDGGMESVNSITEKNSVVEIGERWTDISKELFSGPNDEYLVKFTVPHSYDSEIERMGLLPSLIDRCINALNNVITDVSYLPFSCKTIKVNGSVSNTVYAYIKRKNAERENVETMRFDIQLIDVNGFVFAELEDYIVKRVNAEDFRSDHGINRRLLSEIAWKPVRGNRAQMPSPSGKVLLFKGNDSLCPVLSERFKEENYDLIEVELGYSFSHLDKNRFEVSLEKDDIDKLFSELKGESISKIIFMTTFGANVITDVIEQTDAVFDRSVMLLFRLTQMIVGLRIKEDIDCVIIARYANEITGTEDRIEPENASLFGLAKSVRQEHPNIRCRCIDIDDGADVDSLLKIIKSEPASFITGIRNKNEYSDTVKASDFTGRDKDKPDINSDGVYVISGGTGGLGLEMGKYLATRNNVNIALISRRALPERVEWDSVIERREDARIIRTINEIRNIERMGSKVETFSANVFDYGAMEKIITDLRLNYGRIKGVFHCAGLAGKGFIISKKEEDFKAVLAPKIQGTCVLDSLTDRDNPDFFCLFSSVTSLTGGIGQSDYTAANAFMDSYAAMRKKDGKNFISIDWPAWRETGMAVDYNVSESESFFRMIPTDDALKALDQIMGLNVSRVIVGEPNRQRIAESEPEIPIGFEWIGKKRSALERLSPGKSAVDDAEHRMRDLRLVGYSDESLFSKTERAVARFWSQILGAEEIDINSSFSELGGDSILAVRLLKKIDADYPGIVDISDVFAYDTISEMASYIESRTQETNGGSKKAVFGESDELDELLLKLSKGEISVSEAEDLY